MSTNCTPIYFKTPRNHEVAYDFSTEVRFAIPSFDLLEAVLSAKPVATEVLFFGNLGIP